MRKPWAARIGVSAALMAAGLLAGQLGTHSGASAVTAATVDEAGVTAQLAAPPASAAAQEAALVSMVWDSFQPAYIVVAAGTTVVWRNDEGDTNNVHDVIASDFSFVSPNIWPGESWSLTFWTPGTYFYYCDLHFAMEGWVEVR